MKLTAEATVLNDDKLTSSINNAQNTADSAKTIADNTNQYFWFTSSGTDTGAHISEKTQTEFIASPSGGNLLARSNGIAIREGTTELATMTAEGTDIKKGGVSVAFFGDTARIGKPTSANIKVSPTAITVFGDDGYYGVIELSGSRSAQYISFTEANTPNDVITHSYNSDNEEVLRLGSLSVINPDVDDNAKVRAQVGSSLWVGSDDASRCGVFNTWLNQWLIYHSPNDFAVIPQAGAKTGTNGNPMYVESSGILRRNTSSSARYKKGIEPLKDADLAPERLYEVDVKQFRYREDYLDKDDQRYNKLIAGFIVEELEKVYPIAVQYENGKAENWDGRYLIPPMLKLIQDQKHKIDELEERIEALERK